MSTRKRPRQSEAAEPTVDNKAECPFEARLITDPSEKDQKKTKKRRRTDGGEAQESAKVSLQPSPFAPSGKFKTHETLDAHYKVEPAKRWGDMTRYNSFVLNNIKYFSEGFITVANDTSLERAKDPAAQDGRPRQRSSDDWVARILEIRASDEHHVYARIYWMYWPDEIPKGTRDGNKFVQGRQPYHGAQELVASNHMDIINVVSVTGQANVTHWLEENDEEILHSLYWRQALDTRTLELSSVVLICKCNTPGNPDRIQIGCTTETCKKWLHEECIKHDALMRTYQRLGKDKPHVSESAKEAKSPEKEEIQRPISPSETGPAGLAQDSIGVKSSDGVKDNVDVSGDHQDAPATGKKSADTEKIGSETPSGTPGTGRKVGRPKKNAPKPETNGDAKNDKPYDGLFEVTVRTDLEDGPPAIFFKDLRENVKGGEKEWREPLVCLVCNNRIV